jgi:dipeptidyl aminopeptidase/acylaminoacyl peptidase
VKKFCVWLLFGSLILGGCTNLGLVSPDTQPTLTPLPTTNPDEGLRVIAPTACQAIVEPTIQADRPAGDLVSFSPDGKILAYVEPYNQKWGWYNGNLTLLSLETGESRRTRDLKVAGDISWSPDGTHIAFIALHTTENLYTVVVLSTSDFTPLDLYAAGAVTDEFSSQKGIVGWVDASRIEVEESCGVDCSRAVEISISGQGQQVLTTGRWQDNTSLNITLNPPEGAVNPDWSLVNVSPDGAKIFLVDKNGLAWVAAPDVKTKFQLTLDQGDVQESRWSPDSNLLAVRTNENIFLYDLNCRLQLTQP